MSTFVHLRRWGLSGKEKGSSDDRWKDDEGGGQVIENVCGLTTGIVNWIERQGEIGRGVCEGCGRGWVDEVIEMKMVGSG